MDTPEKNNLNNPLSKFEDSPVFNYINSLSPIPVKSIHVTQTFSSLSFSSPPSVFTSPHVNCHRESRFLKRHNLLETSKPKVLSEDVNSPREENPADSTHTCHDSSELQQGTEKGISTGDDAPIKPSNENTTEPPLALKYNSGSPGYDSLICGDEANTLLELPVESTSHVAHVPEGSEKDSVEDAMQLQGICQTEARIEALDCDWDSLITEAPDLLMLSPPNMTEAFKGLNKQSNSSIRLGNFMTSLSQSATNDGHKMHIVNSGASGSEHEIEDHPSESVVVTDSMTNCPSEKTDDKLIYVTNRGIRRRCLDFEMASVQRKHDDNANPNSSTAKSDEGNIGSEKKLIPRKGNGDSRRCVLPGIGLHLNALANLEDYKSIKNEQLSSGREPNLPSSPSSLQRSVNQENQLLLVPASVERDLELLENEVQPAEDCTQSSVHMAGEDCQQNSPKKKRKVQRKLEPSGEGESCKRCNCKKSKCLKLYCECFAAGVYCVEPCSCRDCFNKPIHVDTVLQTRRQIESRNPLAFAPKVIRSSDALPEIGDDPNKTPASARHKRGCNCKKSNCLKKYCECYQGGVGCSISCRCEGCKNAFGRKDGSVPSGVEAEPEEETEACEKGAVEKASQKNEIQNIEDHPDCVLPITPLRSSRPLLPLPFSSKGKPPRSFVATISASGLLTSQKLGKSNASQSQSKFEKPLQTVPDDDSAITCIKTSSPNGKRISSPNCDFGSSPTRRGGRKLILQSIPSFPSLTPHH
ncbi:hypothetical protein RJT34_25148 [Clitoria ternatea]|uniref:CRC domain-containing protein n=1 Tax=Clitoria ternatea TaxID=43366 RepID=A0AAN9FS04_CLITE